MKSKIIKMGTKLQKSVLKFKHGFSIVRFIKIRSQNLNLKSTNNNKPMDYQALSMMVPRPVPTWNFPEIKKWLHFIHMQALLPLFEKQQLNGQSLSRISCKQLNRMGVKSNIMQKKLMAWIQKGFIEFDQYILSQFSDKQNICVNFNKRKTQRQQKNTKNQYIPQLMQVQQQNDIKIKVTNYEGPQNVYYIGDYKGLKIGRSSVNQIQSYQVTIQNQHSQIVKLNDHFHLVDLGTKSGTFIKINHKIELITDMLIEIGSYLLKVDQVSQNKEIVLKCVYSLNHNCEQLRIDLSQKPVFSFGRRNNNDFARDDQHMSGTHAKIYFFNGKFILEDMGSTNGYIFSKFRTWLRLSQPQCKSQLFKLQDGEIFKIGNTITYICNYENIHRAQRMQIQQNVHICMECNLNERNMLFLPCKHTLNCESCCTQITVCPLCNHKIQQKVKIFI